MLKITSDFTSVINVAKWEDNKISIHSIFAANNFQKKCRTTMSDVFFRPDHFPHVSIAIRAAILSIVAP